jgi:hypothetical protein
VADVPAHNTDVPESTAGSALTVAFAVAKQPVGSVYLMVAIPAETPVITPLASTDAIPGTDDNQLPPTVAELSVVVAPAHMPVTPVIAAGSALTVITVVRKHELGKV